MAIYHLSMKPISRSAGRSSTACAAYRSGEKIVDERTGEVFDFTRKKGIDSVGLFLPDGVKMARSELWNGVEKHHKRGDALVAREIVVAIPAELPKEERRKLAAQFAKELRDTFNVAVDVSIHRPDKNGDERNHHAHLLMSACSLTKEGFGKKVVTLDPIHCQRAQIANPAEVWRGRWADICNERLKQNQIETRIDHRTLEAQKIDRAPTKHLGVVATQMERSGRKSKKKERIEKVIKRDIEMRDALVTIDQGIQQIEQNIELLEFEAQKARRELAKQRPVASDRERPTSHPVPAQETPVAPAQFVSGSVKQVSEVLLIERIKKSLEKMIEWITRQGPLAKVHRPQENAPHGYLGKIVALDVHHAVQHTGSVNYVIHQQRDLDKEVTQEDIGKSHTIKYKDGRGQVIRPELDIERKRSGPEL